MKHEFIHLRTISAAPNATHRDFSLGFIQPIGESIGTEIHGHLLEFQ